MKLKPLLLCFLAASILVLSFFWPPTRACWDVIDIAFFKLINGSLEGHFGLQRFWALANHRKVDWLEDLVFITFFLVAIRAAPKALRLKRAAQFLFLIFYAALIIYSVNALFFRDNYRIHRPSPTLVLPSSVRIAQTVPHLHIKDATSTSFPGDHATTLLLFAGGYALYSGRKLGTYAAIYAIFRCMPRMIAGAHWISDIIVGSGAITLCFLGLAFCTPLQSWCVSYLEAFLRLFKKKAFVTTETEKAQR